jgi:hypothetical protein
MAKWSDSRQVCYIIIAVDKKTGVISGYVENSFSMGWAKDRVRVWRSAGDDSYSRQTKNVCANLRETIKKIQDKNPGVDVQLHRVGKKTCPVSINWTQWYKDGAHKAPKSLWRNLLFKVNGGTVQSRLQGLDG